jgi:hypothetical protein
MKYLKPTLGVAVLLTFIYLCAEFIPPFFHNYQFQDFLEQEARRTSYSNLTEEAIRNEVLKEARGDDLPVSAEQVHIVRGINAVSINVDYTVHVDLLLFPQDLHFTPASSNRIIPGT